MRTTIAAAAGLLMIAAAGSIANAAPAHDWTGAYIGLQGGYAWGETDYNFDPDDISTEMDFDGFVGGATAGINWQVEQFVIGAEADVSFADLSDDRVVSDHPCAADGCSLDIDWFGTARLKLGFAGDTVMPFIAGGLAFGDVEGDMEFEVCGCWIDETALGWTIGGGIEWAFDERWSAKAEYLYVDLGKPDIKTDAFAGDVSTSSFDFSVVRFGLNYHL